MANNPAPVDPERDYAETLLPSQRAIRLERLNSKDYAQALKRVPSGQNLSERADNIQLLHQLLLASFVAYTPHKITLELTEPEKDQAGEIVKPALLDFDATMAKIPDAAWAPVTYQSLVTAGPTELHAILRSAADYDAALVFVGKAVMPSDPFRAMVGNRFRTFSR